jgi:hypothetical protein
MALNKSASSTVKKLYKKASENYSAKLAGSKSLLYNKFVLYAAFIVCIINLLIWLFSGEFIHVAVFMLVGYLTSYFSKNMIVILVISLVVSNVVKSGTNIVLEGMQDQVKEGADKTVPDESQEGADNPETDQSQEGVAYDGNESQEGADEAYEGDEPVEKTCKADKDCDPGYLCNDKYVCAK